MKKSHKYKYGFSCSNMHCFVIDDKNLNDEQALELIKNKLHYDYFKKTKSYRFTKTRNGYMLEDFWVIGGNKA